MSRLVLKYHATRGKEVINLLEMLGANRLGYKDTFVGFYYYIECEAIVSSDECPIDAKVFTLEEFLEKYPYKVGDKVEFKSIGDANLKSKIIYMEWCNSLNKVLYTTEDAQVISTEDITETKSIPPYMDYDIKEDKGTLVQIDFTRELRIADEVEVILGDYEFVLKDGKTYFVKKNKYPKTYEECCKVIDYALEGETIIGYKASLLRSLQKLLICRDAWWKMADDWKPDWTNFKVNKFCIGVDRNITSSCNKVTGNKILAFPTAEMRDAFYDNFKELIDKCKELL